MGGLLVAGAMVAIGLLLLKGKKKESVYYKAFNKLPNGRLAFKPSVRDIVINQLLIKKIIPRGSSNTATLEQLGYLAPLNESAYGAIKLLHEQGLDIWVPQTYFLPIQEGSQAIVWFDKEPPPKSMEYARLIAANEQWPPMPTEMPPVPTGAPPVPTTI